MRRISNVILVGLGGTGSALADPLARLLAFHPNAGRMTRLELWDGDSYDDANVARQVGCVPGEKKAQVWGERLRPFVQTTIEPGYIKSPDDWKHADILILAVDNWATRRAVLAAPPRGLVILPGNDEHIGTCNFYHRGSLASMVVGGIEIDGLGTPPDLPTVEDEIPREGGCQAKAVSEPQTITANLTAATLVMWGVTNWLDGKDVWPRMSFDYRRMEVMRV